MRSEYCFVCKYYVSRNTEHEIKSHLVEHKKMFEHTKHNDQICACGVTN